MNILGIDPGLKGALCLMSDKEQIIHLEDMPTLQVVKTRRAIDTSALLEILCAWEAQEGICTAISETPGIRGGQAGALTVGVNWGLLKGICVARQYRWEEVHPLRWQNAVLGVKRGKDANRAKAQYLWPKADLGKRKTEDRSDAALIALYGLRQVVQKMHEPTHPTKSK